MLVVVVRDELRMAKKVKRSRVEERSGGKSVAVTDVDVFTILSGCIIM